MVIETIVPETMDLTGPPGLPPGEILTSNGVILTSSPIPVGRTVVLPSPELRRRFRTLVSEWKAARQFNWTMQDMVCNGAYLRIIGMGKAVLPLILRELQDDPDQWFSALYAIAGFD